MTTLAVALTLLAVPDGFELFRAETVNLGRVPTTSFKGARGDCFVFVLKPAANAVFADGVVGHVTIEVTEPDRRYTLSPNLKAEGGTTGKYCLLTTGNVKVQPYQSVVIKKGNTYDSARNLNFGRGSLTLEIWKKSASDSELAEVEAVRSAQKQRERTLDQAKIDSQILGCTECRAELAKCQRGDAPAHWRISRFTCMQGFQDCLKTRGWKPERCSP